MTHLDLEPDAVRLSRTSYRFEVTSWTHSGCGDSVDHLSRGEKARGLALTLSKKPLYARVEVFDSMAKPGYPNLWIYEAGKLTNVEARTQRKASERKESETI